MKRGVWLCTLVVGLSVVSLGVSPGFAQSAAGRLVGTVQDQQGAVLVGATVVVTNLETQLKRRTVTDHAGSYIVPELPPGWYSISVSHRGFKTATVPRVELQVNQKVRLDFTLAVGEVAESLTVQSTEVHLETETASLGQVIDEKKIEDLPLNGRNFLQLATLAAGSVPIQNIRTSTALAISGRILAVNIAGDRDDANSYLLDGVEMRQPWIGTPSLLPSTDALQEFKIQRHMFSAEFGQAARIINMSTKSGSNAIHGTVYEFIRNDKLDARNFFDAERPPFKRNQFGFTVGGPIVKNETFFFGNYEGLRERRTNTLIGNFPSRAHLAGDFSDLPPGAIVDPLTKEPFPNNRIPEERMSTVAKNYRQYIPVPNRSVPGANFVTSPARKNDFDQFMVRVDHQFSMADSLFGRYTFFDSLLTIPGLAPLFGQRDPLKGQNLAIQETHTFGPRLINVVRFGYNRGVIGNFIENADRDLGSELGFKNLDNRPEDFGLPTMRIAGFSTMGQFFLNQGSTSQLFQFNDVLYLSRDRHAFALGGDIRYQKFDVSATLFRQGFAIFVGAFTGHPTADFLLGLPIVDLYIKGASGGNLRSTSYNFFLQDDWKVTSNLTLNLGLRYEYNSPWRDTQDRQGFFDTSVPGGVIRLVRDPRDFNFNSTSPLITHGGVRPGVVDPDRNNIAPRFGFAYDWGSKLVIRGGYGIFYSALAANEFTFTTNMPPNTISPRLPFPPFLDALFPDTSDPNLSLEGISPFSIDPHAQRPYVQQWDLSLQTTLGSRILLEVSYSGSKGTHLWERVNINSANLPEDPENITPIQTRRPFPHFGDILTANFRENSNYNALQVRVENRLSHGLTFLLSYTFSKSIDTASSGFFTTSHQDRTNLDAERGRSNFDVRHNFVFSHTYELPFGKGRPFLSHATGVLGQLVSGWQINGIVSLLSGEPFSIRVDGDNAAIGGFYQPRANRLADGNLPPDQRTPERWFDTSAFATPLRGTFGNSGRNIIDGPGTALYDFSLFKNIDVGERLRVQFRAEFFNSLNRVNFDPPNNFVNAGAAFGRITSARPAREIQFGLKLIF